MSIITTPEDIGAFRLIALRSALSIECIGMRMRSQGPTAYATIKKEFSLKGDKTKVYDQFDAYCVGQGLEPRPRRLNAPKIIENNS
tara:strand:+ start:191 stop:448 length:258 start_codon:yes stop_codon:yes gene_type:complete